MFFNQIRFKQKSASAFAFTAIALILVSCAPSAVPVSTECVVNADQKTLFKGHWTARPIPLAVVATDFTASELITIETAITTWNAFFQASKGYQLYLASASSTNIISQVGSGGSRVNSATVCSQSLVSPSGFSGNIMIYKNTSSWTYGSSIMALTSLCPVTTSGSTYRMLTAAVLEVNYIDYFQTGKPIPDLQSVLVHELGHVLGLDHSCNGAGCTNAPTDYTSAIMYPSLGFDGIYGRSNRVLQSNDQERANCLY